MQPLNDTRCTIKASEHYAKGYHALFKSFDRVLAMYHFGQTVRYQPNHAKGWYFYLISIFMPTVLIKVLS